MSNFICPPCGLPCGFNNIDCGKAGYKTDREIELEKKLEIAVKALDTVVNACDMKVPHTGLNPIRPESMFISSIRNKAQEALAKIKEIK